MRKTYCDSCKDELKEEDHFLAQIKVVELKTASKFVGKGMETKPQIVESTLDVCKTCYNDKVKL